MPSPLRFRAWAVEDNEMHSDVQNGLQAVGMSRRATFGEIVEDTADFWVMQSTGRKDVDGVEIFEDDGVVTWDEEGCDYNVTRNSEFVCAFGFKDASFRVLGNICANPDLLSD